MSSSADEIRDLLFMYTRLFDAGDMDGVAELLGSATIYAEGGTVISYAAISASFRERVILYDGDPRTMHVCTNVILDIDEEDGRATARSVFLPLQEAPGHPMRPYTVGRYHDAFERVDGRWRFAERTYLVELVGDMSAHYRAG